ncbi:MAG: hypothetical protein AAF557_26020, partial [Pseudomonadota bacterium]
RNSSLRSTLAHRRTTLGLVLGLGLGSVACDAPPSSGAKPSEQATPAEAPPAQAKADPPPEVREAFLDVQAAELERKTKENRALGVVNQKLAVARGEAAQLYEDALAYSARVVNEAEGEAARFNSVYQAYELAPDVTRKRLYLETMEQIMGDVEKVIIDSSTGAGGQGVVPYLPLNELRRGGDK